MEQPPGGARGGEPPPADAPGTPGAERAPQTLSYASPLSDPSFGGSGAFAGLPVASPASVAALQRASQPNLAAHASAPALAEGTAPTTQASPGLQAPQQAAGTRPGTILQAVVTPGPSAAGGYPLVSDPTSRPTAGVPLPRVGGLTVPAHGAKQADGAPATFGPAPTPRMDATLTSAASLVPAAPGRPSQLDAAAQLVGRTLGGRYHVTEKLGEGAMAVVYAATQDREPHDIALKVMHAHLAVDRNFVKRFRQEARAASGIEHPNVVRVLDCGEDESGLFIAMERLRGEDLFDALQREKRIAEQRAAKIVVQICAALAEAHVRGVVHRDLKPDNVMLIADARHDDDVLVKVLDFGIAKLLDPLAKAGETPSSSAMPTALTAMGMVVGTPAYMSPEQVAGEPVDARSDVYACGILLFQMITGSLPFFGDSPMEIAVKQVQEAPPPPSRYVPPIARDLEALILQCMAKSPAERPQTAAELGAALRALIPNLAREPYRGGAAPQADDQGSMGTESIATLRQPRPAHAVGAHFPTPPPAAGAPAGGYAHQHAHDDAYAHDVESLKATTKMNTSRDGVRVSATPRHAVPPGGDLARAGANTTLVAPQAPSKTSHDTLDDDRAAATRISKARRSAGVMVPWWFVPAAFAVGILLGLVITAAVLLA